MSNLDPAAVARFRARHRGARAAADAEPSTPLAITTRALVAARVGQAFAQQLSAVGGCGPFIWSADFALPAGLTFTEGGQLYGVPTRVSDTELSFEVTDSADPSTTAERTLTLTIANESAGDDEGEDEEEDEENDESARHEVSPVIAACERLAAQIRARDRR